MEKLKKNKFSIILLAVFAICIYLICKSYMLAPDEYNYSHIAWTNHRLAGVKDIITSQISMYEKWTGRVPVHATIQTILYAGTWVYELLNPIIFVLFILLLGSIIYPKQNYFKTSFALFLVLFFIKGAGEKFIWLSGSINYLWTTTIMLGVMYYFYQILIKNKKLSYKELPIFFLLCFLGGWSQENVAFILGSFLILIGLTNLKTFLKYSKKEKAIVLSGIVLFGIGAIILIFSPGNFARANGLQNDTQITNLLSNLKHMKELIMIGVATILGMLLVKPKQGQKNNLDKKQLIKSQGILVATILIALLPMLIIGQFPLRATLPYEAVIIIGILANCEWIIQNLNLRKAVVILEIIFTIGIGYKLIKNVSVAQNYMLPYKEKVAMEINQAKIENQKDVVLSTFEYTDKIMALGGTSLLVDFSPQASQNHIINSFMAIYYDFDSIEAIKDNQYLIKIQLTEEIQNQNYEVIDSKTGQKVTENLKEETGSPNSQFICFIIPKQKLGELKIKLPKEIKNQIKKVELKSVSKIEEVEEQLVIQEM